MRRRHILYYVHILVVPYNFFTSPPVILCLMFLIFLYLYNIYIAYGIYIICMLAIVLAWFLSLCILFCSMHVCGCIFPISYSSSYVLNFFCSSFSSFSFRLKGILRFILFPFKCDLSAWTNLMIIYFYLFFFHLRYMMNCGWAMGSCFYVVCLLSMDLLLFFAIWFYSLFVFQPTFCVQQFICMA